MTDPGGTIRHVLWTGQTDCYDAKGKQQPCKGSGQDGEFRSGIPWPEPRFELQGKVVLDRLTDLFWTRNANPGEFLCTWQEACERIAAQNRDRYGGFADWRLPNRNELRSLISYQAKNPALPSGHPFVNVFLGWYWTATSAAINPHYAWSIHMEGARMFYGRKDQYQLYWPVRGEGNRVLPATGQVGCFAVNGRPEECRNSCQDGAHESGRAWPSPRFLARRDIVHDRLTGLIWLRQADLTGRICSWQQALDAVLDCNRRKVAGIDSWRLPNINELASLVDCSRHSPALPSGHPFTRVQDEYWSATTSYFETDWAWVLYLHKGACGVGHKMGTTFSVWPTAGPRT